MLNTPDWNSNGMIILVVCHQSVTQSRYMNHARATGPCLQGPAEDEGPPSSPTAVLLHPLRQPASEPERPE